MRLRQIYKTIKENVEIIESLQISQSGSTYIINDWSSVINSLEELRNIKMMEDIVEEIYKISPVIASYSNRITITSDQKSNLCGKIDILKIQMRAIINLYISMDLQENKNGIDLKLPEPRDFSEFATNIQELDKFFKMCPIFHKEDTNIELTGSDIGSTWLTFFVGGTCATSAIMGIAKIVEAAMKIKSMWLSCKQQKEIIRTHKNKNDLLDEITGVYNKMVKAASEELAASIKDEDGINTSDEEEKSKLAKSIEILGKLMSKGLEIYSSIEAPEEVKAVFPPIEQQKISDSVIKLIEER